MSPALDGALEFLFVLDSKDDLAFQTASMLASRPNSNTVRVVIATASRTNSQKIHNIQTGIKVRDPAVPGSICCHSKAYCCLYALEVEPVRA